MFAACIPWLSAIRMALQAESENIFSGWSTINVSIYLGVVRP